MKPLLLILIITTILAILILLYFIKMTKLKKYNDRIIKADNNIDELINNKIKIIESINKVMKKSSSKKDYLKDYMDKLDNTDNYEKDEILNDCSLIINDLIHDHKRLANNKELKKLTNELKNIDEEIIGNKIIFNNNMKKLNENTKNIIDKMVAIIAKFKTKRYYKINKTDDGIN